MNKLVVITGGTKGIGKALAIRFAREGLDICTCSRRQNDLDKLRHELLEGGASSVLTFVADLSESKQAKAFTGYVAGLHRTVNILINNAGYFLPGAVSSEPEGALEEMVAVNLYSAYHCTRGILPLIPEHQGSHIFNMCSIASFMAYPNGGSYSISKFALLGFSRVLREELKTRGIRVTAVMPGATMTASWEGAGVDEERLMKASDVADTIFSAWSLSDRAVVEELIIRPQLGDL